jgi:hypothetical protein
MSAISKEQKVDRLADFTTAVRVLVLSLMAIVICAGADVRRRDCAREKLRVG